MELRQLRYFCTVAEEKSISAAAKKLYLSQPPLSTQMRQLEQELGCVLFERGARHIQLTPAGQLFYERASAMLELAARTQQELHDYTNGTHGTLRFGAVSSVCGTVLADWIAAFRAAHPAVQFSVAEGNTYQLLEQLRQHRIELAIVRTPFTASGVEEIRLPAEPMLAVGHASFFGGDPSPEISLRALAALPLIIYRRWLQIAAQRFAAEGLHPAWFCQNDDARTTALWADAGLGVGMVPRSSQSLLHHPQTICKAVADPGLASSIVLLRSRDTYRSTLAAQFMELIRAAQASTSGEP